MPTEPAATMMRICSVEHVQRVRPDVVRWRLTAPLVVSSASAPSDGVMNSDASRLAVTSRLNSEIAVAMRPVVMPA